MPSLKDLKNRIGSVKNTRKITKAMQMVAAAKLRRAQEAAEAARPFAERMTAVMSALAAGVGTGDGAPKLLAGNGREQVHLLVVMTSERGLCGGFNSSIVKLARLRANELAAAGKTVKMLTVGKKGREQLRRDWGNTFVGHVDLSEVKRVGYANAQGVAREVMAAFEAGEVDVVTIFYNRFQSVISQIPTEQQVIPARFEAAGATALYDYEPSEEAILARGCDADLHRPSGKRCQRAGRSDVRDGQRDAQRRRHDQQADDPVQPEPSGRDHQRAYRNHFGRRGALTNPE